ncbi:c-type cytochrome [Methyloceanibacter superfactus]|nr:cytochrome c [Methyloceanibacter superfactus]
MRFRTATSTIEDRRMNSRFAAFTFLAVLAAMPLALAHEGATGVVKERMDLMTRQKDDMKIIGLMAKGKTKFDPAKAAAAARDIEETAAKIPDLFPEGTDGGHSDAKPEIWRKWDTFTGDADTLRTQAGALAAALDANAPDWKTDFQAVIDACKTCHKSFRAEKD